MIKNFFALLAIFFMMTAAPARAADEYVDPTYENLSKSFVRLNVQNIGLGDAWLESKVLDEFAQITACDVYARYFENDFEWKKIREAVYAGIRKDVRTYPEGIRLIGKISLDKYDFRKVGFRLKEPVRLKRIALATLNPQYEPCVKQNLIYFPKDYRLRLDETFYLNLIDMDEKTGRALLEAMLKSGNTNRDVYMKLSVKLLEIDEADLASLNASFVTFFGRLEDASFYLDPALQKPFWKANLKKTKIIDPGLPENDAKKDFEAPTLLINRRTGKVVSPTPTTAPAPSATPAPAVSSGGVSVPSMPTK